MVKGSNSSGKQGSDVPDASGSGNVPGEVAPETLRPNMDADDTTPLLGQSGNGDESDRQFNERLGVRVPQSLIDRYEAAAFAVSEPGERVSRSDLYRQALHQYIQQLEEALEDGDDDGDDDAGEIVTRGFSDGGDS